MFCKHCGKEIADDSKFCAFCGTNIEEKASKPITSTVNVGLKVDPKNEARDSAARNILTLGICSLALSCSFYFSFIGWILGGICRSHVRDYEARFGPVSRVAKVGKHLGNGGYFGGIGMTILFVLYLAVCFAYGLFRGRYF